MTIAKVRCLEVANNENFTVGRTYYLGDNIMGDIINIILDDKEKPWFINIRNGYKHFSRWTTKSKFRLMLMPKVRDSI